MKGDARMGELLRRALEGRRRPLDEDVSLRVRFARATLARRTGERARGVHRRPTGALQVRSAGAAVPSRERGPSGVPRFGPAGCRRGLVRGRAHLDGRVLRPPRPTVADGLPRRACPRAAVLACDSSSASAPGCSPRTNGSCSCGLGTPPCPRRRGASTISPCSTRPPSSPEAGPEPTATSSSTRHRT